MQTLPYDYARCAGTAHTNCDLCRRRDPGNAFAQSYIAPPIDVMTGECGSFIEPIPTLFSDNTAPNVAIKPRREASA